MDVNDLGNDPLWRAVTRLPVDDVGRPRAEQIRRRCHRALDRRRWYAFANLTRISRVHHVLEPAFVTLVCAWFLSEIARRAVALFR